MVTSPTRVEAGWKQSLALGERCEIPLAFNDPNTETRVFLKHNGLVYLEPLGDWKRRDEVAFLPEAPGSYEVRIQWRSPAGATGWIRTSFEVGRGCDLDPFPRLVTIDRNIRLWAPSAWESQMAVSHEKAALTLAAQALRKDAVIYDIGANLGVYSVLLSRMAGAGSHVYCIEANPVCLYFLQANLALNDVPSFEILPAGILGADTTIEFTINYRNLFVGKTGPTPYMGKPGHKIEVRATALDDLIELQQLRPPDFIKMDIEGAEVDAIKGMRSVMGRYRPAILVELHGQTAARETLAAADWNGYEFEEATSGQRFLDAAQLSDWFPDACLQILARPRVSSTGLR
jgi:FkbM family methyltransferase